MEMNNDSLFMQDEVVDTTPLIRIHEAKITHVYEDKWTNLFKGFTDIKVLTFSTSLSFLNRILGLFQRAELLFGNENVIHNTDDLQAYKIITNKLLIGHLKFPTLKEMVDKENLEIFICNKKHLSHKKIFLLSNCETGAKRVIWGSANLSKTAFEGGQGEIVHVNHDDDIDTYNFLLNEYQITKANAFIPIPKKILIDGIINQQDIPITDLSTHITEVNAPYIEIGINPTYEKSDEYKEERQLLLNKSDIKDEVKEIIKTLPNLDTLTQKTNDPSRLLIPKGELIVKCQPAIHELTIKKQEEQVLPQIIYNHYKNYIEYNGKEVILNYDLTNVKKDIDILFNFFSSYESIIESGNILDAQEKFFATMNFMFLSPFTSVIKEYTERNKGELALDSIRHPMYLIFSGLKSSGKSFFTRDLFLHLIHPKAMFHMNNDEATPAKVLNIMRASKGYPILIDDVSDNKWKELAYNAKKDSFGTYNVSSLILTTNHKLRFEPAIQKRIIYLRTNTTRDRAIIDRNTSLHMLKEITGDFYKFYLSKMLLAMNDYFKLLHSDASGEEIDLLYKSFCVINDCITEAGYTVPIYAAPKTTAWYTYENSERDKKNIILRKFYLEPSSFKISDKIMTVTFPDYNSLKSIIDLYDYPLVIDSSCSNNTSLLYIKFDYTIAKQYFNFDFKPPTLFTKLLGRF